MKRAFTLIEILVAVGIIGVTMVVAGTVMTNSFKARKTSDELEALSAKALFINGEMKRNILDARSGEIHCPAGGVGSSISFATKSGGNTSLLCDSASGKIASASANGYFSFNDSSLYAFNCDNFVSCSLNGEQVVSIGFSLALGSSAEGSVGATGYFQSVVAPRE